MTYKEFTELALSYREDLYAYARRLCHAEWDADDLLQSAYEHAFRRWGTLRHPALCRGWLFRIVRNLHIDRTRATSARSELRLVKPGDCIAPEPIVPAETVERLTVHQLEWALTRLPREQAEAVLLCDLWGFTYEEIMTITDTALGTVRSRISRGRLSLSRLLVAGTEVVGTSGTFL